MQLKHRKSKAGKKPDSPRRCAVATGSAPTSIVIDGARIVALAKEYAKGAENVTIHPDIIVYLTFNAKGLQRVHTILYDDNIKDGTADIDIEGEDFEAVCKNLIAEVLRVKKEKRLKLRERALKKLTEDEQWALGLDSSPNSIIRPNSVGAYQWGGVASRREGCAVSSGTSRVRKIGFAR